MPIRTASMRPEAQCTRVAEELARRLARARDVIIIGHVRPDADAIGSVCALRAGLAQRGVRARGMIGQRTPLDAHLLTIPGASEVEVTAELPAADVYVAVDCASIERTGLFAPQLEQLRDRLMVIDHHGSNPGFGQVNWIWAEAESTTILVAELLRALGGVRLDRDLAHALYAGLVTDTGHFRWGTPRMHAYAERWIAEGLDSRAIAMELGDAVSVSGLQTIGRVLHTAEKISAGQLELAVITVDLATLDGQPRSVVEAVIDMACAVTDVDVVAVLKELQPGGWSVSLRSSSTDVGGLATALGGGGHRMAAGVTLNGTRDEVVAAVQEEMMGCPHGK